MNYWKSIINNVKPCIAKIMVFYKNELLSLGTGTIINENGFIITANHVLYEYADNFENYNDTLSLLVESDVTGLQEYTIFRCNLSLPIHGLKKNKELDIAVIKPKKNIKTEYYVPLNLKDRTIWMEGEMVIMGGYSEETSLIFNIDEDLNHAAKSFFPDKRIIPPIPITFKHGMISCSLKVNHHDKVTGEHTPIQVLHVDNSAHSGMSGGPIFNSKGSILAVICQRNIIKTKLSVNTEQENKISHNRLFEFDLPSGNSWGIGVQCLDLLFRKDANIISNYQESLRMFK